MKTPAPELALADGAGTPLPCQVSGLRRDSDAGRVSDAAWTVLTLAESQSTVVHLVAGKPAARTQLALRRSEGRLTVSNDRMPLVLADWSGTRPGPLARPPGPLLAVALPQGNPLGAGTWRDRGAGLRVTEAETTVSEHGPVRITVRQRLALGDGRAYNMTVTLGARQDAALIREHSTAVAPDAALVFALQPGLEPGRGLWHNQWRTTPNAVVWSRVLPRPTFTEQKRVCQLRPWSFWWLGDISEWAGFCRKGAVLRAVSATDGKLLAEGPLDATPAFDGLIAVASRLVMSTTDGQVLCLEGG